MSMSLLMSTVAPTSNTSRLSSYPDPTKTSDCEGYDRSFSLVGWCYLAYTAVSQLVPQIPSHLNIEGNADQRTSETTVADVQAKFEHAPKEAGMQDKVLSEFKPKTSFGRELLALRRAYVEAGGELLDEEGLAREFRERRGGLAGAKADLSR